MYKFLLWPVRKAESFWCSIHDAKDILLMLKWSVGENSVQHGNQLMKWELVKVSKKVTL